MYFQHIYSVVLFTTSILCATAEMKSVKDQPTVRLMNAVHGEVLMPVTGLGTFGYGRPDGSRGEYWGPVQGYNATVAWLKLGGRRLDSSDDYASRDGVGTGWVASGVPRSEIFITSKVDPYGYNETLQQFAGILTSLQTNYIDLLLIHWPGRSSGSYRFPCLDGQSTWAKCRLETWQALETIFNQGQQVRAIGVSNYEVNHLLEIFNLQSNIPSVNQVEFHPYWHEDDLLDFCNKHNITFNSYSPGGAPDFTTTLGPTWNPIPDLRKHPNVTAIAQKHGKSPAQVMYRWHWQQGIVINPRTRDPAHMIENMSIFDFQLDNEDMMTLSYLNHPMSKVCGDPRLIL
jgi:diketogulonate reductase-like aldo/keto reductase